MAWLIISDSLHVRLVDGKPEFYSEEGLSLSEVLDRVRVWTTSHEDPRADAWIEAAEEDLNLGPLIEEILESFRLRGSDVTWDEARMEAIRRRQFEDGEQALGREDYSQAKKALLPLAESGNAEAQFYMGIISAKGFGGGLPAVQAYIWFEAAAQQGHERARLAATEVFWRLTRDEVATADRIVAGLIARSGRWSVRVRVNPSSAS